MCVWTRALLLGALVLPLVANAEDKLSDEDRKLLEKTEFKRVHDKDFKVSVMVPADWEQIEAKNAMISVHPKDLLEFAITFLVVVDVKLDKGASFESYVRQLDKDGLGKTIEKGAGMLEGKKTAFLVQKDKASEEIPQYHLFYLIDRGDGKSLYKTWLDTPIGVYPKYRPVFHQCVRSLMIEP